MIDASILLQTRTICIRYVEAHIVLFERTASDLPQREARLRQEYQMMVDAMPQERSELDLIVDSRRARGRNDEVFERVQADFREPLFGGFRRLAVIVRSQTGRLQARRYREAEPMMLLDDLDEAVALLRYPGSGVAVS